MLTCDKCNIEIEEGNAFCPECGGKLFTSVFCPECGEKSSTEFAFCQSCGCQIAEQPVQMPETQPAAAAAPAAVPVTAMAGSNGGGITGKLKTFFSKKNLALAGAGALTLIVVVVLFNLFLGGNGKNSLLYAKDGELVYTVLPKAKPFELSTSLRGSYFGSSDFINWELYGRIVYSKDRKYVYFPEEYSSSSYAEYCYLDLSGNHSKGGRVDTDINVNSVFVSDDGSKFFYTKSDARLYVFDRKKDDKEKLDNDVSSFSVTAAGDYIIYQKKDGTIYEMDVKKPESKTKIDLLEGNGSSLVRMSAEDGKVCYIKERTLYVKEKGKDKVKITSDVAYVYPSTYVNSTLYFSKSEDVVYRLADYVDDDMKSLDDKLAEPAAPIAPVQGDFQIQTWVPNTWGSTWNAETQEWGRWSATTDWDAYNAAYDAYTKDRDSYYEAREEYYQKVDRDNLREALADPENNITFNTNVLYYYDGKNVIKIADDIFSHYASAENAIVYSKNTDSETGKVKISEVRSVYDVRNMINSLRNSSPDRYLAIKDKEILIEQENASDFRFSTKGNLLCYLNDYTSSSNGGYGTLMTIDVSKETGVKPEKLSDDVGAYVFGNDSDNIYYFRDVRNNSGDLYFKDGKLASDVYVYSLYSFPKSDSLLYLADYSQGSESGTLFIHKGGKASRISDDVAFYSPQSENSVVYLTDYSRNREKGDAMLYTGGKKSKKIDEDVTSLIRDKRMFVNYQWQ